MAGGDQFHQLPGQLLFGSELQALRPAGPVNLQGVEFTLEAASVSHLVRRDHVQLFIRQFLFRIGGKIFGFRREAYGERRFLLGGRLKQDVRRFLQLKARGGRALLKFAGGRLSAAVVGDGRRRNEDVAGGKGRQHRFPHLLSRHHFHQLGPLRRRQRHRPRH